MVAGQGAEGTGELATDKSVQERAMKMAISSPAKWSVVLLCLQGGAICLAAQQPKHLMEAEALVDNLQRAPLNVYGGGKREIHWTPPNCSARTVCSSFCTLLLEHTYGYTPADFRTWMSSTKPKAAAYHDAIVAEKGFQRILKVTDIQGGDFLAIKFTDGHISKDGVEDSGHIMLVAAPPIESPIGGTGAYDVPIIDSSHTGHGPTDTRHKAAGGFNGGIGRGTFRIFVDTSGQITSYAWSTSPKSEIYSPPARDLVVGRLKNP